MKLLNKDKILMKQPIIPYRLAWKDLEEAVELNKLNKQEIVIYSPVWVFSKIYYYFYKKFLQGSTKAVK